MASNSNEVNALMRAYDEGYEKGKEDTLNDFIEKTEEERDNIYNWDDDDYFIGMREGYQYSIEIAEQMKEQKNEQRRTNRKNMSY